MVASHVSHNKGWRWALGTLCIVGAVSACGSTTTASTPSITPVALNSPVVTPAPSGCPTAAKVGAALGITLPKPTGVPYSGGTPLPAGATGIACDYHAQTYNVIIELLKNIDPSYISQFSSHFPVPYVSVSGVGDQARSFTVSIGGGRDNEGVVATKGRNLVALVATATPASLAQIEALVNQLL
jgi:hypothetical protein